MCGQGEETPYVPQLQCLVWLKPRVEGAIKSEILREKPLGQRSVWSRAGAQGRFTRGQCVHTAQGWEHNVQGAFGDCVATVSFPLGSACLSPWPPGAEETHLRMGMGRAWKGNSAGSGLGLRDHILSEELSRCQAVRGPGHLSVCLSPQSCWSDSSLGAEMVFVLLGEGGLEARRWGQSCQIQDQEASDGRRPSSSSISSRRRRPAS